MHGCAPCTQCESLRNSRCDLLYITALQAPCSATSPVSVTCFSHPSHYAPLRLCRCEAGGDALGAVGLPLPSAGEALESQDMDWSDFLFNLISMCIVYAYFSRAAASSESLTAVLLCMAVAALDILLLVMRWLWCAPLPLLRLACVMFASLFLMFVSL